MSPDNRRGEHTPTTCINVGAVVLRIALCDATLGDRVRMTDAEIDLQLVAFGVHR